MLYMKIMFSKSFTHILRFNINYDYVFNNNLLRQ